MKLRLINSLAMILYGYQTGLLMFALPMAALWEAQFFFNRRWALSRQDFYQIADLSSLGLLGILVFLFNNRAEYHFVSTLIQWLPILLFPLLVLFDYSTTKKMSLDILFYSLRRRKHPAGQSSNSNEGWDQDYLLFGLVLVAAGTNPEGNAYYFPIAFLLILAALYQIRPQRYRTRSWLAFSAILFLLATASHLGIRASHVELKQRVQVWLTNWIQQRNNALKTRTAIGSLGQLKLSDEILFRVKLGDQSPSPGLLQEATYDLPTGGNWTVMHQSFETLRPIDDFVWSLDEINSSNYTSNHERTSFSADIYLEFTKDQDLVPVPPGISTIKQLPALELRINRYSSLRAIGLVNTPGYSIEYHIDTAETKPTTADNPPSHTDTYLPPRFDDLLQGIPELSRLNKEAPIESLQNYFADFEYRLYQDTEGAFQAFSRFLNVSKAGHCEYFATASVLILRKMGVPARYSVGYALQEYNPMIGMYLVRQRHAHAWASAFIDGRWQVVDMTPSQWVAEESAQEMFLQPVFDLVSNLIFIFQLWLNGQKFADYELYFYFIGIILATALGYRIYSSDQVLIEASKSQAAAPKFEKLGTESTIYELETLLNQQGHIRNRAEPFALWFSRLGLSSFKTIIKLHNQWRFDPAGIDSKTRTRLYNDIKNARNDIIHIKSKE